MTNAEATAPTRIDLAGGLLGLWPGLSPPAAVAINVAVDRRAFCRVEAGHAGIRLESKDTLAKAEGPDVASLLGPGSLSGVAQVLDAVGVRSGLKVVTQSRVPPTSGLGGSSALAVAVASAALRAVGRDGELESLLPKLRDASLKDLLTAVHGGVLAIRIDSGRIDASRLLTDPGRVEESLVLVDTGAASSPGLEALPPVGSEEPLRRGLAEIASAAGQLREALLAHRYHDVPALIDAEWEVHKRLIPGVTTPEVDRLVEAARSCGGAGKALGAGGGGMAVVWCTPARRRDLERLLAASGFRSVPFRLDLRGLEVE
jgi:D-glycero-alpha-D-manno-heptose-7-phosphate kinase